MLIFGLTAPEVNEIRTHGHNPKKYYESNADLKRILNMIRDGFFTPDQPDTFKHIFDLLVNHGDHFLLLADFEAYIDTQKEAARLFLDKKEWTQKSILNVARIGKFSSDRTIAEYAKEIWNVKSIPIEIIEPRLDPRH
jgi:starch phosphorylase